MKTQHSVKLIGCFFSVAGREHIAAKTHQAGLVDHFLGGTSDNKEYFTVSLLEDGYDAILLTTPKGEYTLKWNEAGFFGIETADGIKIHVMLKKIVGQLIYWA